jgi:AraC family transcriptional regulator of adaptative response / DNA-3-methyladenine glycosylase II
MELTDDICYAALLAHDSRFDGVFFTCVTSTGVYCRPVCRAIVPKRTNCTFVATATRAERAGFRPCLRCRPEHAPAVTGHGLLTPARQLAAHIDRTLLIDQTLADASREFSISERQLRRQFVQDFGVEPKQYVTSRRLLFAKQLLQDTTMPVVDVAYAAGFSSRGRLTINMTRVYGFTPERLRKTTTDAPSITPIILRADYRLPFHWEAALQFLAGRATPREWVAGGVYYRLVGGYEIMVTNVADKSQLAVHIPVELSRQAHHILGKVRALFDLNANPLVIAEALLADPQLARLIATYPGLRVPGCWDNFEMLLRVIVGQQVSVAGATTIMRRLVDRIGLTPSAIAASSPEAIAGIGMPGRRAMTIWTLGRMVAAGELDLDERDPQLFYERLLAVPGIGSWTAEYLKMRVLRWPDAFPAGDLGLQKAITPGIRLTERQAAAYSMRWRPWRSYATILLWKSLENNGG